MDKNWLTKKCESFDAKVLVREDLVALGIAPKDVKEIFKDIFHRNNYSKTWKAFREHMESGDQLWRYRSPKETWQKNEGTAGYAIVREKEIVKYLTTSTSETEAQ